MSRPAARAEAIEGMLGGQKRGKARSIATGGRRQRPSPQGNDTQEIQAKPAPLLTSNEGYIGSFRQTLEQHHFNAKAVHDALGTDAGAHLKRVDLPLYERRLVQGKPLHTLIKLFTLQLTVEAAAAQEALWPLSLEEAAVLGIIHRGGGEVQGGIALSFSDGLWLAHDALNDTMLHPAADHVLGPNPAAATLARLVVRRPVQTALDVGTGCGVQALLCARHSEQVIATDTNPRALNYTVFNARLNRLPNVECRLGSLFKPVAGLRFDLIVCNPPFVISPESEYLFRDGGLPGDQLSEQVVRTVPDYLVDGGFASILCSWTQDPAEEWSKPLKDWVRDNDCDAWLLHGVTQDPLSYAAGWNRGLDAKAYGECLDRWQQYYHRLGIRALSLGAVVLRRRQSGLNWLRTEKLDEHSADSCSEHILRLSDVEDYLAAHPLDEQLLAQAYRLAEDQQIRQSFCCRGGKLILDRIDVEMTKGLRLRGVLGPSALRLLALCDGQRTVEEILATLATSSATATPADEGRTQAAALVRQLLSCGFLLPVGGTAAPEPALTDPGGMNSKLTQALP